MMISDGPSPPPPSSMQARKAHTTLSLIYDPSIMFRFPRKKKKWETLLLFPSPYSLKVQHAARRTCLIFFLPKPRIYKANNKEGGEAPPPPGPPFPIRSEDKYDDAWPP